MIDDEDETETKRNECGIKREWVHEFESGEVVMRIPDVADATKRRRRVEDIERE